MTLLLVLIMIVIVSRKGTIGVSSNGVTANVVFFFDRGTFWVLPVNLLLSPQKSQGIPFSPTCRNYFCSGPISVDPICLQPNIAILKIPESRFRDNSKS